MCLKHSFFVPSKTEAFPYFEVLIYFGMSKGQNFMVEVTGDVQYSLASSSGIPRNFVQGGVQQIQLRTQDRENGDLGAVAP